MTTFLNDWRRFYGDAPPLSFALAKDERWARFHALPDSKRYAETPDEAAEILRRANAIASDVLGGDPCWIAQLGSERGWGRDAVRWRPTFNLTAAGGVFYDEFTWPIFAGQCFFQTGAFDGLLSDIAADNAFRTLWLDRSSGSVFAPYDGGFDVFCQAPALASELREKYQAWRSARADGM